MSFAQSETPEQVRLALGAVLRRHREVRGRTLTEVAAEAGLSPAHLSEVERGRKEISTELLLAVGHALEVPAADLYVQLAQELGSQEPAWPADPRQQLRRASAALDPAALRTLAHFGVYLASAQPARRPIGFQMRRPEEVI
ncbi:MAG TPA: helix-turn-helix transcriptional regulator [Candidatus Acidoferrales bacterium]|nr:helix-turn-helix transcriptional regulator [Candidatus Acidoferrales bacterium]